LSPDPLYRNLRSLNTFGVPAETDTFVSLGSPEDFRKLLEKHPETAINGLILGGGSNVLFVGEPQQGVIKTDFRGISMKESTNDTVLVTAGAGENWHQLVTFALAHGLCGIENLSLIPGNCGAAPMQNIGAYGVELEQVFHELEAIERSTGRIERFDREACRFGYRDSIFKQELRDRFIITSVTLRLSRKPNVQTGYGAITQTLDELGITNPSPADVSRAVIKIRRSKLPDWKETGNAGSFFKNPVVTAEKAEAIRKENPTMPAYAAGPGKVKIPAAWLIEQSGWKGVKKGDAGTWPLQPLVLVNYGQATGSQILELARGIRDEVLSKFGIRLEPEVNLVGIKQEEF